MYPINLAEQDFFTNLGFVYPDLFKVLPCHFNAQTSIQVLQLFCARILFRMCKIAKVLTFKQSAMSKIYSISVKAKEYFKMICGIDGPHTSESNS
jgi:hypothetical protein